MRFDEILNDGLRRAYHLALSAAEIEELVNRKADELAKDAVMPGFRRGKVPLKVIKSSRKSKIRQTVIQERVREEVDRHFKDTGDQAVDNPVLQIQSRSDDNTGFECELRYELFPSVPELDLSAISLARPVVYDLAAEQEAQIADWFKRNGALIDAGEDHVSAAGDEVTWSMSIVFTGAVDKETPSELLRVIADPDALAESLPNQSVGVSAGHEMTVAGTPMFADGLYFPGPEEGTGETRMTVRSLRRRLPLEASDENARNLGYENLEALKSSLKDSVSAGVDRMADFVVRVRLFDYLDKALDFELPPSVLDHETENIRKWLAREHNPVSGRSAASSSAKAQTGVIQSAEGQGADRKLEISEAPSVAEETDSSGNSAAIGGDVGGKPGELEDDARQIAVRRLKAGFFLNRLIKEKELPTAFTANDIRDWIIQKNPNRLQAQRELEFARENKNYRRKLANELSEQRAVAFILSLISFTDEEVSTEELKALAQEGSEPILGN